MFLRKFFITLALIPLFTSSFAFGAADDYWACELKNLMNDPKVNSNPKFWEEYSRAMANGMKEQDAKLIAEKYKIDVTPNSDLPAKGGVNTDATPAGGNSSSTNASPPSGVLLVTAKSFEKDYEKLKNAGLRKNTDAIVEILKKGKAGFLQLRGGGSQLEKVPEVSPQAWGARVNNGYRVIFEYDGEKIKLLYVNDQPYRH